MTLQGALAANGFFGTIRRSLQLISVQLLHPLAILDVTFTLRHMSGLPRIDHQDFQTSLFDFWYNGIHTLRSIPSPRFLWRSL